MIILQLLYMACLRLMAVCFLSALSAVFFYALA
jgi:hypothetical protein